MDRHRAHAPSKVVGPLCLFCLLWLLALAAVPVQPRPGGPAVGSAVTLLTVDGPIGPAYADYIARGVAQAAARGHQLAVLRIDTPGGLDTAMRLTVRAILDLSLIHI